MPTLQNLSEKSNSIGVPCKTSAKTRVGKTNFECQRNAETKKHYGTRGENANVESQHCKTVARRALLYGPPCKTTAKTRVGNSNFECQRNVRKGKTLWNTWWKREFWVPTLQPRSEKSNSIGIPCKTAAKTRVGGSQRKCELATLQSFPKPENTIGSQRKWEFATLKSFPKPENAIGSQRK